MADPKKAVVNFGSTLGEAIGSLIEVEVNRLLMPIAQEYSCVYVTVGLPHPKSGKPQKLLLRDMAGNEYNIDAVIANARMQPLVLIESKYIRYVKHNRDKGSWICTAHYSLRRSFPTVRKSIAVLAGNWSSSSKAMLQSFDVTLFEVGFAHIREVLASYNIDIGWGEKERDRVMGAWHAWQSLNESQKDEIAHQLLAEIEPLLKQTLKETLDGTIPREIQEVEITIETTLGESRRYIFSSLAEAITFLEE